MKSMRWSLLALMTFVAACGTSSPPPVAVTASTDDVRQLAGRWSGSYDGLSSGRHGSIIFTLQADNGTARGDVVMVAEDRSVTVRTDERPRINAPIVQPLNIQFVVISGHDVSGMLDPYEDPTCHCLLSTTFAGRVDGDRIKGQFVTWGGGTASPQRGTWSVRRTRVE
jgi:hypothetical protein